MTDAQDHDADRQKVRSFLSFDVEALPGRANENPLERLVWGQVAGGEYGIRRLSKILGMHGLVGNFLIDFGMCLLYGDKTVKQIVQFLLEEGHEVHAHLHSEWVVRKWGVLGNWQGPLGLDRTDEALSECLLQFTAWKYESLTGLRPSAFRAGGYLFSDRTIAAAKRNGFRLLTNYNASRHSAWTLPECTEHNSPFLWDNRLLELPVDLSPEPLTIEWDKYIGMYERSRRRKAEKTFNLVLHSWSLLRRNGEVFESHAPEHEERFHAICEHLAAHTQCSGYEEYLRWREGEPERLPTVEARQCVVIASERSSTLAACSICGFGFTTVPESDICPGCGARARHRQLQDVFVRLGNPFVGRSVLANYANAVETRAFLADARTLLNFDVRPVSEVELQMDLQNLSAVRSGALDAFLGIHVLNHVQDDERALDEIARVLKPGGLACLTIPYRENYSTSPHTDVTEHYGKEALERYGVGTFRRYGYDDALALFAKQFEVETQTGFDPVTQQSMAIFLLRKRTANPPRNAPP